MFGVNQKRLLSGLENIRGRICCYFGDTCDCKYGIGKMQSPAQKFEMPRGEQTGGPEVRMAMELLSALSEEEFNSLCLKAGVIVDEIMAKELNKK